MLRLVGSFVGYPAAIAVLLAAGTRAAHAQALPPHTDVIHGRVIAADSTPIQNATVAALAGTPPAPPPHITRTDAKGQYSITIENGPGVYIVGVTVLGYAPQRRTITRRGTDTLPAVDFKLVPVATQLGAVRTTGERPKPPRSDATGDFTPGASNNYVNVANGMTGDVTGDLATALSMVPGVTVTPSATGGLPTVTAFGQTADQNSVVLNGLGFGGTPPRDGFSVNVVSATYDPSRAVGAVQLSLRLTPGSNYLTRSVHATVDAPALQETTPIAQRLGTLYDQQVVSGVVSGPVVLDKAFYSFSYQVTHRASELTSLSSEDPTSLLALRVNPDSVSRLLSALGPIGLQATVPGVPSARASTSGQIAARFDFTPSAPAPQPGVIIINGLPAVSDDYYLQFGGTWRSTDGSLIGPTSVPAAGGQQTHRDGWLQFTAAKYLPLGFLNEASTSLSASQDATNPYLDVPSARVLVSSPLPDGTLGVTSLQVGGAATPHQTTGTASVEVRDQLSRFTWDRRHQMALTVDGTLDRFTIAQDAGLGAFAYNSLTDFTNGLPASYSRVLNGRNSEGAGLSGAIGLGDTYAPATTFRTQFGVRLEANHVYATPAFNPAVDSTFGLRTDHVPSTLAVLPMAGFTWQTFGHLTIPGLAQGFPRGSISGGIREYRGSFSTQTVDGYSRQTGLAGATQQLYCVGAAAPTPNWTAYAQSRAAIPSQCADGTLGTPLAQTAPPVALFAPDYALSRSWRPDLNVNYSLRSNISMTVGGTYALSLNQPGAYDINFVDSPKFSLASEGNRPVYVAPSDIIGQTGTLAWTDSRASQAFAHVAETRSDLRTEVRQFRASVSFRPSFVIAANQFIWVTTVNYAHNDGRQQSYGFTGTTSGDPTQRSWSRTADPEHAFNVSATAIVPRWFNATLTGRAQSGLRFTPSVAGDINGDGYSNDRAFVFDPALAGSDTSIANPMARLLSNGSSSARSCLSGQLNLVAARNSCTGPWSFNQLVVSIQPDAYRLHLGNRGNMTILFTNVLAGLDQFLHGPTKLHGWGQFAYPDATLLTVRGFDPAGNRFIYTVNPQFGSTSVFRNTFRSPFVMSVDFRLEVGPDRETQFVRGALRPVREEKGDSLTLEQIKAKISPRAFNPLDAILQRKDSLGLSQAQVDSLTAMSGRYAVSRDSIVTALARFLVARHGDLTGGAVRERWHTSAIAIYMRARALGAASRTVFTPEQLEKLKGNVNLATFIVVDYTPEQIEGLLRGPIAILP